MLFTVYSPTRTPHRQHVTYTLD